MMHPRRAILDAIKTQLILVPQFKSVRNTRSVSWPAVGNDLPCVTLHAESEQTQTLTIHLQPRPQERTLTVTVRVWNGGSVDIEHAEEQMDMLSALVEQAMVLSMAGVNDIILLSTDFESMEEEPLLDIVTLIYQISYCTNELLTY